VNDMLTEVGSTVLDVCCNSFEFIQSFVDDPPSPWNLCSKWPVFLSNTTFAVFASKIQFLSKEVCYRVSFCKTFQQQSCSYIIPYLMVHRRIVGDVSIYLKFALKVTHPRPPLQKTPISTDFA